MNPTFQESEVNFDNIELTRQNVEKLSKYIKLVDSDPENNLDLFCYIHCKSDDPEIIKQCRGVVFHHDTVVMKGFPYNYEYTRSSNEKEINENIISRFDECRFFDSYEGSLIRMFNFNGKWYVSTNRKLDAFRSKWAAKESFGYFFVKALESEFELNPEFKDFLSSKGATGHDNALENLKFALDPAKQYMFLLVNNDENRIVCEPPDTPMVFHVGTFYDDVLLLDDKIGIHQPTEHHFSNPTEMFEHVESVDYRYLQGLIVFTTTGNAQYKIFNEEYADFYAVRGNEPSIKFRYLQVRMNKRFNDMMHFLYPKFSLTFDDYENHLYTIAKQIHTAYISRFIKKNRVSVPGEEFQVIHKCHSWHLENRDKQKVTLNKVIEVLNEQPATNLNKMIKRLVFNLNNETEKPFVSLLNPKIESQ